MTAKERCNRTSMVEHLSFMLPHFSDLLYVQFLSKCRETPSHASTLMAPYFLYNWKLLPSAPRAFAKKVAMNRKNAL